MKLHPARFIIPLLLLLLAAGCHRAPKRAPEPVSEASASPAPTPTATPAPTPESEPTATPARPIEYVDNILNVTVSEVLFSARGVHVYDEAAGFVEMQNCGSAPATLAGFYLSDSFDDPERFALPDLTLAPGECFAFKLTGAGAERFYEIPFLLSDDDDGLLLYYAPKRLAVKYVFPERPKRDVSVAPISGGGMLYLAYPTPGERNADIFRTEEERANSLLSQVYFSEVSASGSGWIELCNGSRSGASLLGWTWTDDPSEPAREQLSGRIEPGCVAAFTPRSLRISATGETLYLYDSLGFLRDTFPTGVLTGGWTSGRSGSIARVFFSTPSKGEVNRPGAPASLSPSPVFSETELYHDTPFTLTLTCPDPRAVIYYTLDGTEPTEADTRYTAPFPVHETASVRAVALSPGKSPSPVAAAHYLVGVTHTLPVICIDMDPTAFRHLTKVPDDPRGLEEQPCSVYYFETDGKLAVSFPAGIKPRGNTSISYVQKSLSLHLRVLYGQKNVYYDFWHSGVYGPYEALVLRNSGQDDSVCHLRDAFAQSAAAGLYVDTQHTQPVIVYVNGSYYGILDLNENLNKATFALRYGVDKENVNIVQRNDVAVVGSAEGFIALRRFAAGHDLSDDAVLSKFAGSICLPAVTDYIIAQSFFGNFDIHNQNWWASADNKVVWRPFLYDVDRCLTDEHLHANVLSMYFNPAGNEYNGRGDKIMMEIYCALKQNRTWRTDFLNRFAYLLCHDFSADTLLTLFDTMTARLRPEMERHALRFRAPRNMKEWEKNVSSMRQNILGRYEIIVQQICDVFDLSRAQWDAIIAPYLAGAPYEPMSQ